MVNSFGVFQTYYTEDLLSHQSESNISWIGSLQAFLLLAFTLVGGPLHDLGHTHMQLLVCSALAVFGLMMTSLCTEYWQFMLAQGVCMGLGFGGVFITSVAITPSYFSKKRGLALGIAASGSSIGMCESAHKRKSF
jgi:MFS family permease